MNTIEITADNGTNYLAHEAITMALAILIQRIQALPKDDRDDLFELVRELPNAQSREDTESIVVAMREILEQKSGGLARIEQPPLEDYSPKNGLQKWVVFISEKIRTLRIEKGMTQEDLATASGLPQSHISRLECGRHSPSHATVEKIAKALGVEVATLDPSA